jgi:heme/copper-type cytochrome/quinol oxidase subunit 4
MFEAIKQLLHLSQKSNKLWLIPLILFLCIVVLLVISAQISPVPVFLYPII